MWRNGKDIFGVISHQSSVLTKSYSIIGGGEGQNCYEMGQSGGLGRLTCLSARGMVDNDEALRLNR